MWGVRPEPPAISPTRGPDEPKAKARDSTKLTGVNCKTYESIVPGEPAYADERGAWISVRGYEEYIAGDLLRFRTKPAIR
jgi:hypothetical protein